MSVIDDDSLLKLAEAEILGEVERAKRRHATAGPAGWQPVPKANKSFLVNTLLQTLSNNRILSRKRKDSEGKPRRRTRERKLLQKERDREGKIASNILFARRDKRERERDLTEESDLVKERGIEEKEPIKEESVSVGRSMGVEIDEADVIDLTEE